MNNALRLFVIIAIIGIYLMFDHENNADSDKNVRTKFKKMYPSATNVKHMSINFFNPDVWSLVDSNGKTTSFFVYGDGQIIKDTIQSLNK